MFYDFKNKFNNFSDTSPFSFYDLSNKCVDKSTKLINTAKEFRRKNYMVSCADFSLSFVLNEFTFPIEDWVTIVMFKCYETNITSTSINSN